jgi:lauroyl/myristoyl acyltransferase
VGTPGRLLVARQIRGGLGMGLLGVRGNMRHARSAVDRGVAAQYSPDARNSAVTESRYFGQYASTPATTSW